VLDSLNSIIWDDDAQVYDLRVIKTYGDPCLVTEITW
jgi:Holliday junction resolvase RusA-like endonuclease